ncbi:MAG: flavodoxin family protein [Candidatus Bathyarchaeia archaeon]|jgi:flavodoxin
MNSCVVYFSRTGNTKHLAQAIADTVKVPIFDLASTQPSALTSFDLLILGTPVEGSNPAKETTSFINSMTKVEGKKAILFTTYKAFGNERTMKKMEKQLEPKGYKIIAKVSKKGMKPDEEADFSKVLEEVKKALEKQ